jgi:hypothetical protein
MPFKQTKEISTMRQRFLVLWRQLIAASFTEIYPSLFSINNMCKNVVKSLRHCSKDFAMFAPRTQGDITWANDFPFPLRLSQFPTFCAPS